LKTYSEHELDFVFGRDSTGRTPEERAITSKAVWIRTQNELSYRQNMEAWYAYHGHHNIPDVFIVSSVDALRVYGMETLIEAIDRGSSVVVKRAPGDTVRDTRQQKGWTHEELAQRSHLSIDQVADAEDTSFRSPYKLVLVPICQALGLDPLTLGL
jgi:hypothetical protein